MNNEIMKEILRIYNSYHHIENINLTDRKDRLVAYREYKFDNSYRIIIRKGLFLGRVVIIYNDNNDELITIYTRDIIRETHFYWGVEKDVFKFGPQGLPLRAGNSIDSYNIIKIKSKFTRDQHFNMSLINEIPTFENMQSVLKFNTPEYFNNPRLYGSIAFDGYDLEKLRNTTLENLDERTGNRIDTSSKVL